MAKRGPKSKYDPKIHPQLVKWMCRSGLTNEQIAEELHIHKETLLKWAKENTELADALKTSRNFIDSLVEDALLKRALGYSYIERKVERGKGPKGPVNIYSVTTKKVIPDVTAMAQLRLTSISM